MVHFNKLLAACAVVVGLALVGATSASTKAPEALHAFQYNPPTVGGVSDYSQTNVQDPDNWSYTADVSRCSDEQEEACKVFVSDTYAIPDGSGNFALDPAYTITATPGTISHVTETSDGTDPSLITNKDE